MDPPVFCHRYLDPRSWEWPLPWTFPRTWAACPVATTTFGQRMYAQVSDDWPAITAWTIFAVWSGKPSDTWLLVDHPTTPFGIQIDPVGALLRLFDQRWCGEIEGWHTDPVARALTVMRWRCWIPPT